MRQNEWLGHPNCRIFLFLRLSRVGRPLAEPIIASLARSLGEACKQLYVFAGNVSLIQFHTQLNSIITQNFIVSFV